MMTPAETIAASFRLQSKGKLTITHTDSEGRETSAVIDTVCASWLNGVRLLFDPETHEISLVVE
jgi:hypothetical protein